MRFGRWLAAAVVEAGAACSSPSRTRLRSCRRSSNQSRAESNKLSLGAVLCRRAAAAAWCHGAGTFGETNALVAESKQRQPSQRDILACMPLRAYHVCLGSDPTVLALSQGVRAARLTSQGARLTSTRGAVGGETAPLDCRDRIRVRRECISHKHGCCCGLGCTVQVLGPSTGKLVTANGSRSRCRVRVRSGHPSTLRTRVGISE